MHNGLKYTFIFTIGAAIGAAVTCKVVKTKYEQIAHEEIESVKEQYKSTSTIKSVDEIHDLEPDEVVEHAIDIGTSKKPDLASYMSHLQEHEYVNYSDGNTITTNKEEVSEVKNPNIRVIPPDEYGEKDGYRTLSFTYYADEILTNEANEVVDDIDNIVGSDSLTHFGEFEEDSVFVRNDDIKCDIEILLDERKYTDVMDE